MRYVEPLNQINAHLTLVGPDRAQQIINDRPFQDRSDVDNVLSISKGMIDDLKSGGCIFHAAARGEHAKFAIDDVDSRCIKASGLPPTFL